MHRYLCIRLRTSAASGEMRNSPWMLKMRLTIFEQRSKLPPFFMNGSLSVRLRRFWCEDGVFVVLMLVLFGLRFWPAFAHGALYAPFQDNVWIYGPLFSRASEIALTGNFPYWLDTVLGGFPLYQTPHFSATYPFYFFGLLNYGKAIQVMYTLSYLTCFHNFILYLNLYIMLRVAGAKGLASLCGATISLVSGNTEIYAHWITIAAAWSWFPLLIAGMIRLLRAPLSFESIALFSVAAGLICTAMPSQPVIQSAIVGIIFFTAAALWQWRKEGVAAVGRLLSGLSITGLIAFGLAAVAFLPMTLATGGMIRHVGYHPPVIGYASIPWESFNASQLEPRLLSHLLFDSSDLGVVGGLYVGPLALLGILLCIIAYHRGDALTRFLVLIFGSMALYFLVAGFGTHFGLAYLHFHIPLLNLIREAARYLVIFTTLTALLAGLGLQIIMDVAAGKLELNGRWRRYFWIATTFGLLVFLLALAIDRRETMTSWLVLAILPLGVVLLPASSRRERMVGSGLLLLACFASVLAPPGTQPFFVSQYLDANNLASHRVLRRLAQLTDIAKYRVVIYRVVILDSAFSPPDWGSNASFYGIRTFYLRLTPQPIAQFREMFDEPLVNLRKLRGAKYFVCGRDTKPFDPKARLLFTESEYGVYEVADPMEPYTLVHAIRSFPGVVEFRTQLAQGFDYQHIAALKKSAKQTTPPLLRSMERSDNLGPVPADLVEPISRTPNVFDVLVNSSLPGVLILNERWSKDWHARVNSLPAKVLRVNFTQPAVMLPAGRYFVEFEYKPVLFWYLLILQRITFLLLLLFAARKLFAGWGCSQFLPNNDSPAA